MLQTRRSSSYSASSPTSISMTLKGRNGYNVPSGVSGYTPGQICYFPNDSKYLCGSLKPLNASVFPRLPLMDKWFITSKKPPESRWRLIYIAGCNLGARSQPALAVFLPAASQTYATVRSFLLGSAVSGSLSVLLGRTGVLVKNVTLLSREKQRMDV